MLSRVKQEAPKAQVWMLGFSQGACLALETVARRGLSLDGLIALSGARIGPRDAYVASSTRFDAMPVLLGVSSEDSWVDAEDVQTTAVWFAAAGAPVETLVEPGNMHHLSARQRIIAGAWIRGETTRPLLRGFGNAHETEALPGALPQRMNSPRPSPYGLYAEQVNGTGFVATRHTNLRTWMYRVRPAAQHTTFTRLAHPTFQSDFAPEGYDPN